MFRRLSCLLVLFLIVGSSGVSRAGTQKWEMAVRAANPLHWYRFNEAPGTTEAFDGGSGGLNGVYRSLVELGQEGLFGPASRRFEAGGQDESLWTQAGTSQPSGREFLS